MATDRQLDDRISTWLEGEAPMQLPDRVLRVTFDRTRKTRQHVGWRALLSRSDVNLFMSALGGAAAVVVAAAVALGLYFDQSGVGAPPLSTASPAPSPIATPEPVSTDKPSTTQPTERPPSSFEGSWEATDHPPDRSHLTMAIVAQPDGAYEVTVLDDSAAVCDGVSSTMVGVADETEPGRLVIEQPDFTCDDGSPAEALGGPPLEEQLRDLTFTYDIQRDEWDDSLGLEWTRVEVAP